LVHDDHLNGIQEALVHAIRGAVAADTVGAMWLAVIAVALGAALGWVAGRLGWGPARRDRGGAGWPSDGWRWAGLGAAGLLLMGLGGRWIPGSAGLAVEAVGYAAAVGFALVNWRHPGLILVTVGLAANLLVISVDGGMPVRSVPAETPAGAHHHGLGPADGLAFLGDDLTAPVVSEQVSAGDLLIASGGAVLAFTWMVPVAGRTRRRRPAGPDRTGPAASPAAGVS
jgi:Family of unknown function (DUF5317)